MDFAVFEEQLLFYFIFFYASHEPHIGEEAVVKKKAKRTSAQQMR